MMNFKRRDFMKTAGAGAAAAALTHGGIEQFLSEAGAVPGAAPTNSLVLIYLRGGMDALNCLVPHGDKRYYELRPTIAIPKKDDDTGPGIIKLDDTFGLHPSLKSLKPFWDSGQFAGIINVGSPHGTRSHFDAQDFMEYAAPGQRTVTTGWLNRYLGATQDQYKKRFEDWRVAIRALAMQPLLPRSLRGRSPVLAVPAGNVVNNSGILGMFEELYDQPKENMAGSVRPEDENAVIQSGKDTIETLKRFKKAVGAGGGGGGYSGGLGRKLSDIAKVIRAGVGLEVAALDIGGWDHHTQEGGNVGTIAQKLKNLSDCMAAFAKDIGKEGLKRTLVMVVTEFGRNSDENGNRGTDHGRGGSMLLLGGGVKGGKIHGDWTGLDAKELLRGRDLPIKTDFRNVFGEVLKSHFDYKPEKGFFPQHIWEPVPGLFA